MTAPLPPDPAFVVMGQLFPPGPTPDTITVYDGTSTAKGQNFAFRAWDLRGPILKLAWDLLRFMVVDNGKLPADRTMPVGLRDSVNITLRTVDQNNTMLRRICKSLSVDISDLT
jgi:hypothetical protein